MKKILHDFRLEITILLLALIGVVLMVGNFGIMGFLRRLFFGAVDRVQSSFQTAANSALGAIQNFSLVDLIGGFFAVGAITFVYVRVRHRYREHPDYAATVCPRCGGQIHRVHRSKFDRLMSKTLLPDSRRYRCVNQSCGWSGLRHKRYRSEQSGFESEVQRSQ